MATIKQRQAAKKLSEIICKPNHSGKASMYAILREAGYSESVARKPQLVTECKGWQELMDTYLPDEMIVKQVKALLGATKTKAVFDNGKLVGKNTEMDYAAVAKGIELACKLKGKFTSTTPSMVDPYSSLSDEELDGLISEKTKAITG